ncbi:magnesium transporter MgtE N-terminal domain-containing protein [Sphingomonas sp. RS6]
MPRPSLLLLMAAASAIAAVANAAGLAAADQDSAAPKTRLGNSIERDLSERDADAARRKRALDLREQAAKAAESRLQADLEARQKADAATAPGAPGAPGPAEAQFDDLARIYQAMKPAKAAVVFEQLEMEVQMKVAQRMRANSTAAILAAMSPKAAAALSMALARKNAVQTGKPTTVADAKR